MKKKILWVLVAICVVAVVIFVRLGDSAGGPLFSRLAAPPGDAAAFKRERGTGNLSYVSRVGNRPVKPLTSDRVTVFTVKGRRSFRLPVTQAGRLGFYTFLYFRSHGRLNLEFELNVIRNGEKRTLQRFAKRHHTELLVQDVDLRKGDNLELRFSGSGFGYFSSPALYKKVKPAERDYVFIIGIDTFRKDMLGARVNGRSLTPNIDAFSGDSVDFSHAYAQSSWTLASFMSLFTGMYEFNHQVFREGYLRPEKPMLVESLARDFLCFSLNGGGYVDRHFGYSRGFDYYRDLNRLSVHSSSGSGRALFDLAGKIIDRAQFPRLFMFLHTYQIHQPYAPPMEFLKRINPDSPYRNLKTKRGPYTFQDETDAELKQGYMDLYQAEILAFDHYFGQFVKYLKEKGLYRRAMIVFMSDHGEEFYEHHGWEHGHGLYNEQIHVPLLIKYPGNRNAGKRIEADVEVVDILPTILDHYQIPADLENSDGRSLNPLLEGKEHKKEIFSSFSASRMLEKIPPKFAVISGKYKLIYNYEYSTDSLEYFKNALPPVTGGIELYDLEKDPLEKNNLAQSHSKVVSRMMPTVIRIKKIIKAAFAEDHREKTEMDGELKKQLETLGYL